MKMNVVLVPQRREECAQPFLAARQAHHFDFSASEVAIGSDQREPVDRRLNHEWGRILGRFRRGERVVDGAAGSGLSLLADTAGEVALRVDVNEQDSLLGQGERSGQVDSGRRLADAPFLVGNGDDAAH